MNNAVWQILKKAESDIQASRLATDDEDDPIILAIEHGLRALQDVARCTTATA